MEEDPANSSGYEYELDEEEEDIQDEYLAELISKRKVIDGSVRANDPQKVDYDEYRRKILDVKSIL